MGTIFVTRLLHRLQSGAGGRIREKRDKMSAFAVFALLAIASSATASREDLPSCFELPEPGVSTTCCSNADCSAYRGTKATTVSGRKCQPWASQKPHKHTYTAAKYPNGGLEANYCRNPDAWKGIGAWCYTADPKKRWESCGVPACKGKSVNCEKCRAKAFMLNTAGFDKAYVPTCDAKNGFTSRQCELDGKFCFCVMESGATIPKTRKPSKLLTTAMCDKARKDAKAAEVAKADCVKRQSSKGFKPKCDKEGNYVARQCLTKVGFCWCSLSDGRAVPNTIYAKSTPTKSQPKCERLIDLRYVCANQGFFTHPFGKERFIKCGAGGRGFACSCPAENQIFSAKAGICICVHNSKPYIDSILSLKSLLSEVQLVSVQVFSVQYAMCLFVSLETVLKCFHCVAYIW